MSTLLRGTWKKITDREEPSFQTLPPPYEFPDSVPSPYTNRGNGFMVCLGFDAQGLAPVLGTVVLTDRNGKTCDSWGPSIGTAAITLNNYLTAQNTPPTGGTTVTLADGNLITTGQLDAAFFAFSKKFLVPPGWTLTITGVSAPKFIGVYCATLRRAIILL